MEKDAKYVKGEPISKYFSLLKEFCGKNVLVWGWEAFLPIPPCTVNCNI
jgi:hypothetical protein